MAEEVRLVIVGGPRTPDDPLVVSVPPRDRNRLLDRALNAIVLEMGGVDPKRIRLCYCTVSAGPSEPGQCGDTHMAPAGAWVGKSIQLDHDKLEDSTPSPQWLHDHCRCANGEIRLSFVLRLVG
eukprot:CAMPEP_0174244436 /NCGR_PEP_ID=MMETSP0417-20130205/35266_1 /TAXON_ID=242541 /ORGANISM="Mayorella sp, Strain BSH-02190019" /LENGTH=123 /DNA_ID=CAMNT_0015324121 /DNA_START=31 /DNA_END=402 /DNA_ORIENTATION=+